MGPFRFGRTLLGVGGIGLLAACMGPVPPPHTPGAAPELVIPEKPLGRPEAAERRKRRSDRLGRLYREQQARLLERGYLRTASAPRDASFSAQDLARNFINIALYNEYSHDLRGRLKPEVHETTLHRWTDPIKLSIGFGASVPEPRRTRDRANVRAYAQRLSQITGVPITETAPKDANFFVLFLGQSERRGQMQDLVTNLGPQGARDMINLSPDVYCAVGTFGDGRGEIIRKAVAIIRDENPPLFRKACIHEEMAQGMGLTNDSPQARPSIFNDDEEFALLTKHDEYLLRILYDPRLKPGMTRQQAAPIVTQIAQDILGGPT